MFYVEHLRCFVFYPVWVPSHIKCLDSIMYSFSIKGIDFSAFCYAGNHECSLRKCPNDTKDLWVFALAPFPIWNTLSFHLREKLFSHFHWEFHLLWDTFTDHYLILYYVFIFWLSVPNKVSPDSVVQGMGE